MVSGPSGSGKDSLVSELQSLEPELSYSVSATTRAPRKGEVDGIHYHFISRDEFMRRVAVGGFIETREYAGNMYGTPRRFVEDVLAAGRDLVMKPEVNGAMMIKAAYPPAVLVFLTVPSENALRSRLEKRNTESAEAIARRLEIARREAALIRNYDYLIVNDSYDIALKQLHGILIAERLRIARLALGEPTKPRHA